MVQPLWKIVWKFLKKLKIQLPYDLAILFLAMFLKKKKKNLLIGKDTCTPMFIAALSTIAKLWKQPKCPSIDEWIKKMWCAYMRAHTWTCTHTHNGIPHSHKKCETLPFAAGIMLSEINQTEKDKYCMISLLGGI